MTVTQDDTELKTRHRAMWASGDYPRMVETFLLPLGPRLVEACGIGAGDRVLDVAAGTGNASIPAARRGAHVVASDLTPELLEAGRRRAEAAGLDIEWVTADAERLPFESESFDVVMSSIGVMFAPAPPGGGRRAGARLPARRHDRAAELDARGHARRAVPDDEAVRRRRRRPGAQSPPLWGSEEHLAELFGDRVMFGTLRRDVLEITAFEHPRDYGEHFKAYYGPTIAARANAARDGREREFDAALDAFCDEWNRGTDGPRAVREGVPAGRRKARVLLKMTATVAQALSIGQAGGSPRLKAADQIRRPRETELVQRRGRQARLVALVAHENQRA